MTRTREVQASVGQRLLWLKLEDELWSAAFNCPILCRLHGIFDNGRFTEALKRLYMRHEALRTSFLRRNRKLLQLVHADPQFVVHFQDFSSDPEAAQVSLRQEIGAPMDPVETTSRVSVWRVAEEEHLVCLNMHHLITDTWSCMILQRDLPLLYEECSDEELKSGETPPALPAVVPWQFAQFVAYQQRQIAGEGFRRHREYWEHKLQGACAPRIPLSLPKVKSVRNRTAMIGHISATAAEAFREIAVRDRVTTFTVLLSVYYLVLREITGQPDLTIATVFANRLRPEVENTVGFIANLTNLRTCIDGVGTFSEVVARVRDTVASGIAHQAFPYHLLPQGLTAADSGRLDRFVFQMLGEPIEGTAHAGGLHFQWLVPEVGGRFDLELAVMPVEEAFGVKLYYAADAVGSEWARRFLEIFLAAAENTRNTPDTLPAIVDAVRSHLPL